MTILGINFGHDAAASIIKGGKIVFSIEEEKISRIKQDFGWPKLAIAEGFKQIGVSPADIDIIAVGGNIYKDIGSHEIKFRFTKDKKDKWFEYANRILAFTGFSNNRFSEQNKAIFESKIRSMGFTKAKLIFYNHHLCHAAGAYYCSPFTPDLVITCDGHGDGESFNFYTLDEHQKLVPIKINDYRVSVGAFYSAITQMLGFRPTRHEGKITGLAAYGKESPLVEQFLQLFRWSNTGELERFPFNEVEKYWNHYSLNKKLSLSQRINLFTSESETGTNYTKCYEILLAKVTELSVGYNKEDIAYATQNVAEKIVVEETVKVISQHFRGKRVKIALAGGVFANVRINQKLYELSEVEIIFVQPAMGDSGLSIGAAILADIEFNKQAHNNHRHQFTDTYHGPDFSYKVDNFLSSIKHEYSVEKMSTPPEQIAELLRNNYVIGFWHGKMEWGPRALGKRSMIINTFDKNVNDSVNKRLNRTEFMPFAPSVIDYIAKTYMPNYDENCPAGDYMTITYDVAPEFHNLLQAVVHVDGTARPQIVRKSTNSYYYDIIDAFYKLTGCGAIVNTSFNVHEEPIVSTPESAFKALKDDRIDILIIEDYLIRKPRKV